MKDETFAFISDVKDKKITARSARHQRSHTGKGGRVRLPSDNLSKKELQKMNGECKSYRLNDPMAWKEFKAMPDDIKCTYIKLLRNKFNVPFNHIGKMLGCCQKTISDEIVRLGLSEGRGAKGRSKKWDKEGFYAWWNGVEQIPAPAIEEVAITQEEKEAIFFGEEKGYVEDDLPFEEPEAYVEEDIPCIQLDPIRAEEVLKSFHPSQAELEAKAKAELEWLRTECDSLRMNVRILEAQMEVVRLIFGGNRNGT